MTHAPTPHPWRTELGATLRLAAPLAAANLLQMTVYAVDVIFVARLGQASLAAASLATSLFGLMIWSFSGFAGAVAPLIAAELGASTTGRARHALREVRRSMRMALWLAAWLGVGGMALCRLAPALMTLTGQDPAVVTLARGFLGVLMWVMVPQLFANVLRIFVSALGRPVFATFITALAILVNAAGNYAFVFGHFGAPRWGLEGAATATALTALATLAAYVVAIQADRRLRRYHLWGRWWRAEWARLREIIRIGLPIAGTVLAEGGLFGSAAFLMGRLGPAELAGHTIALQVAALAFQIPFGVGQAATIRVGWHYGAGDQAGIGRAGSAALAVGIGFAMVNSIAMLLFPRAILAAYVDVNAAGNAAMAALAVRYLAIGAAFQLADGVQAIASGALRGLQDTRMPMVIALFGYWLPGFGMAVALGFLTPLRGLGVWIGLAAGLTVVAVLLLTRWARRARLGLLPG